MAAPVNILLVDDDHAVLELMGELLRLDGHRVTPVTSGRAALERIRSGGGFDVVITDQSMPGMPGDELIRELRVYAPDVRCLLVTGYGDTGDLAPGTAILRKPFRAAQLSAAVAGLLS
jgi:two-component system, cell cycle sensor histidine kinase and response regulator CckA